MDLFIYSGNNRAFAIFDQQQQESQDKLLNLAEPQSLLIKTFYIKYLSI